MKCTKCGLREATTEVLQRHNNHIEKMYLCNECAKDFRPDMGFDDFDFLDKLINGSPMGLVTNFGGLFGEPTTHTIICPDCKTTSEEFMKTGFVGCPRCYEVFEPLMRQTVKKLQQSDMHTGKSPYGALDFDSEEAALKSELQACVDRGDYSKAAEISAQLEQLRSERNGKEGM